MALPAPPARGLRGKTAVFLGGIPSPALRSPLIPTFSSLESSLTRVGTQKLSEASSSPLCGRGKLVIYISPDTRNYVIEVASLSGDKNSCSFCPLLSAPNPHIHSESSPSRAAAMLPREQGLIQGRDWRTLTPPVTSSVALTHSVSASVSAQCKTIGAPAPVRKQIG